MTVLSGRGPLGTAAGQAASGSLAEGHGVAGPLMVTLFVASCALLLAHSAALAE
ncbi:hypothetical protein [Streptomyces sp. NPDC007856]|uniref:hypothetical protein n=1 Tax=Streptomyces sp. NPDC007856 TaxID=3364781 RepID=UPI003682950D